jgi:hypothetical protein
MACTRRGTDCPRAGRPEFDLQAEVGIILFAITSRPILSPTQPYAQGVPEASFRGANQPELTTHLCLVPTLRRRGGFTFTTPPLVSTWHGA